MKKKIEEKLKYYEGQFNNNVSRFIKSNKRIDRDSVIVTKTKITVYKELLEELKIKK